MIDTSLPIATLRSFRSRVKGHPLERVEARFQGLSKVTLTSYSLSNSKSPPLPVDFESNL